MMYRPPAKFKSEIFERREGVYRTAVAWLERECRPGDLVLTTTETPMIDRYTTPEMDDLWTKESKYKRWLDVEIAVVRGWVEAGVVPAGAADEIEENAEVDVDRIHEIEKTARHDVAAFVQSIEETVGADAGKWVHFGITSSDILDTALALQIVESLEIIDERIGPLLETLEERAREYRDVESMGRTHGVFAEPTSLGLLFAGWYDEMGRHRQRLRSAKEDIGVGQVSGPVGNYASVPPEVERVTMERLGLRAAPITTQIVGRERHASLIADIGVVASSIEKIATEIRHRSRSEVGEFSEAFREGQKGSSAMPHKKNPVLTENLTGLARLMRSHVVPAMEDVALWHERDISHSSVERVIIPDATTLLDFGLRRLTSVLEGLVVDEEALQQNLESSGGRHKSQYVMLELIKAGRSRDEAYELVQQAAFDAEESGRPFLEVAEQMCDLEFETEGRSLRHVDYVFERVFET